MKQRLAVMNGRLAVMNQRFKPYFWIFASFLFPISVSYGIVQSRYSSRSATFVSSAATASPCQTIIADPKPPTNIRSSPIVAPDNTLGQLSNGTLLKVVDKHKNWLKITHPIQGWVYKELTVTSCNDFIEATPISTSATIDLTSAEQGARLLEIAQDQYQAGNLNGAIALAKTVSPNSPVYQTANQSVMQWQRDWERAESEYYNAQKSLREGRWEEVINKVNGYPDIRYWKEKLALVVQQATQQKQNKNSRGN